MADKTGRSNKRRYGAGKSHKNLSSSAKGNQIFQKIVGSQRDGMGRTEHNKVFTFGAGMAQLIKPSSKASPSSSIRQSHQTHKPCTLSQPRKVSAIVINSDGGQEQMGNILQRQSHTIWGRHDKLDKERPN